MESCPGEIWGTEQGGAPWRWPGGVPCKPVLFVCSWQRGGVWMAVNGARIGNKIGSGGNKNSPAFKAFGGEGKEREIRD